MRRAITLFLLAAVGAAAFVPVRAWSGGFDSINAIGLVDFYRKPTFKPGDWVKYRLTSESELGEKDDYTVTVLIAGEEEWWGEDCFWVETTTEHPGKPPISVLALMSYAVFGDSLAVTQNKYYLRKQVNTLTETGDPKQELVLRPPQTFKTRQASDRKLEWYIDTLDVATVTVPRGTYTAQKILFKQAAGGALDFADSTRWDEVRENRTIYRTLDVPITSIALEEIESIVARKTYERGKSQDVPMIIRDRAFGRAQLVEFGSGMASELIAKEFQRPLSEQRAAQRRGSRASR